MSGLKSEYWKNTLTKLRGKVRSYDFVGFDVETYGDSNDFMSGGLYWLEKGVERFEYFVDKEEMLNFVCSKRFKGKWVTATNLGFDLTVLFWGTKFWNKIDLITRGSDILMASYDLGSNNGKIRFVDTFNYAGFSVEKLGKIIGIGKIDKPVWLGERKPCNSYEWFELKLYNKRDCEISCKFMYFLQKGINDAGGNLKVTIASTSLDVWRRNFLPFSITKESFFVRGEDVRGFIFSGYYGGRTEVFRRGYFEDLNYYDVNSLYPSVMRNRYPVPSSVKKVFTPHINNILNYEGVSECLVNAPYLDVPLLPVKVKGKLVFPVGNFKGVWNNVELRKALELGYKIKPLKQVIYTKSFFPFKDFVNTFYAMRSKFKSEGSNMELIYKLLLNSIYGKFAQKNRQKVSIKNIDDLDDSTKLKYLKSEEDDFYEKDGVLMEIKKQVFDGIFSFPILSSYTTSYARLLMYDYLVNNDTIYTDTDSVVIKGEINNCDLGLGNMKHEGYIKEGIFIRPKYYYLNMYDSKNNKYVDYVKVKGVNRCNKADFLELINGGEVTKMKFSKLRESIRKGITPNTKIFVPKKTNIYDEKRVWGRNSFNPLIMSESSSPLELDYFNEQNNLMVNHEDYLVGVDYKDEINFYLKSNSHIRKKYKGNIKELRKAMNVLLNNGVSLDTFDFFSLGVDKPLMEYVDDLLGGVEL